MRGYDLTIRFTRDEQWYLVWVYQQPFHRWLIARLYHWYAMKLGKMPGFSRFERWHHRKFGNWDFPLLISDKQSIRCAELSRKDKVILGEFTVDKDTYVRMGGIA